MITSDHKTQVLNKLRSMKDGEIRSISNPMDIEAVKIIIDWGQDRQNGFSVCFNSSYTKIMVSESPRKKPMTQKTYSFLKEGDGIK